MTKFQVTKIEVGTTPTRVAVSAAEFCELRPAPEAEGIMFLSSEPHNVAEQGYPIPAAGFRWPVKGDGLHVVFYVASDGDFGESLHVIAR